MNKSYNLVALVVALAGGSVFGEFVDNTEPDASLRRAIIKPSLVRLEPSGWQKFKIVMSPRHLKFATLAENVKWSVNGIPGGNEKLGTIDAEGLYRAPAGKAARREINISAHVPQATNRYLFATVLLGNADNLYKLVRTWYETTDNPKHLGKPHGLCLDEKGNLLIVDREKPQVMRFTAEGEFLANIGEDAAKPGSLSDGRAAVIDKQGRIWVCDQETDEPRLHVFSPTGELLHDFGHQGVLPGQVLRPHGLEFDSRGRLFVVDVDNFRVSVYEHSGRFLYDWGTPGLELGEFNAPHGITIDPSDDVFVSNYYGPTQKFDANGNLLCAFAYADPPDGPIGFHSISSDQWGNVYMTVRTGARYGGEYKVPANSEIVHIVKYNNNGDYVTAWSLVDPEDGPSWIEVDNDGTVYCLFTTSDRVGVQVFKPQ